MTTQDDTKNKEGQMAPKIRLETRPIEVPNELVTRLVAVLHKLALEKNEPQELSWTTDEHGYQHPYYDGDTTYTDLAERLEDAWAHCNYGIDDNEDPRD